MIKDFETVKNQLKELSEVINNFKSEAVQLRIIELIFKGVKVKDPSDIEDEEEEEEEIADGKKKEPEQKKRKRKVKAKSAETDEKGTKKSNAGKSTPSPYATLDKLHSDGFFKGKKLIGDIKTHCKDNLALTYQSSDLSPVLIKMIKDGKLSRAKNKESQYEYINA